MGTQNMLEKLHIPSALGIPWDTKVSIFPFKKLGSNLTLYNDVIHFSVMNSVKDYKLKLSKDITDNIND